MFIKADTTNGFNVKKIILILVFEMSSEFNLNNQFINVILRGTLDCKKGSEIVTHCPSFSRALHQLHVMTSSF